MPFALVVIGLIFIITAINGTYKDLGNQLVKDFTGKNNFTYWLLAIGIVGAIGYVPVAQKPARLFLLLIIIGIILANDKSGSSGFFQSLTNALNQGPVTPQGATPLQANVGSQSTFTGNTTSTANTLSTGGNGLSYAPGTSTGTSQIDPFTAADAALNVGTLLLAG